MNIHFVKLSPTQNITLLIPDPVPREEQGAIAARLMAWDGVAAEQVGYIEQPALPGADARLQMMGGEFCGNAAMSLGALLAAREGLMDKESRTYNLEVSGTEGLTECTILRLNNSYLGRVRMPLPYSIDRVQLDTGHGMIEPYAVAIPGITHVMLTADYSLTENEALHCISGWCDALHADALGILFTNTTRSTIKPLVYVPETGSLCWERGCGSGTAAFGCWMALQAGTGYTGLVHQPGGDIQVEVKWADGKIVAVAITGEVRILAEGTAYL